MSTVKAVLFDLDGTLANTLADLADSANHALHECGYPVQPVEAYRYFVGNGIALMLARAADCVGDARETERLKKAFLPYYAAHFCDKTTVYAGMPETLETLRKMGIKLAVITNKVDSMAKEIVRTLYPDCFSIVCGQQDGYACKPDPQLTLQVMEQLGVLPQACLFVGDSDADMQTAQRSGAIGVGALWGFRTREELVQNGAAYLAEKPSVLPELISQQFKSVNC